MSKFFLCSVSLLFYWCSWGLVIVSDRPQSSMQPLLEKLKSEINRVEYRELSSQEIVANALRSDSNDADVVILKDTYFMAQLVKAGVLQAMPDLNYFEMVHPVHRDSQKLWLPLSFRVRSLAYHLGMEAQLMSSINHYRDLSRDLFLQAICLREPKHHYNLMLFSHFLRLWGVDDLKLVFSVWEKNLAKPYYSSDRAILDAIVVGDCDVGIVNSYYVAQMVEKNNRLPLGFKFLDDGTGGSHSNGIVWGWFRNSSAKNDVIAFMKVAYSDDFQLTFSRQQGHYAAKQSLGSGYLPKYLQNPKLSKVTWNQMMETIDELERHWFYLTIP